jgi:hypothetical protein
MSQLDNIDRGYSCTKCGRQCKDKKGQSLHENKCGVERSRICTYCNSTFASVDNLNRHYLSCKLYQKAKEEETKANEKAAVDQSILKIKEEYEEKIKQYEQRISPCSLQNELDLVNQQNKEQKKLLQEYTEKIYKLETRIEYLNEKLVFFAEKALSI